MQKEKLNNLIDSISHALEMAQNRLEWYRFNSQDEMLTHCGEWIRIANDRLENIISVEKNPC